MNKIKIVKLLSSVFIIVFFASCHDEARPEFVGILFVDHVQTEGDILYSPGSKASWRPFWFKSETHVVVKLDVTAQAGLKLAYVTYSSASSADRIISEVQSFPQEIHHKSLVFSFDPSEDWGKEGILNFFFIDHNDNLKVLTETIVFFEEVDLLKYFPGNRIYNSQGGQGSAFNFQMNKVVTQSEANNLIDIELAFTETTAIILSKNQSFLKSTNWTSNPFFLKSEIQDSYIGPSNSNTPSVSSLILKEGASFIIKLRGEEKYAMVIIKKIVNDGLTSSQGGSDNDYIEFEYVY